MIEGYHTDPPLKAPTGFRTGKGVASANLRAEVVKLRVVDDAETARITGRMREAIFAVILLWELPESICEENRFRGVNCSPKSTFCALES